MTDYFANFHETIQALRHEYEPPCPPPALMVFLHAPQENSILVSRK